MRALCLCLAIFAQPAVSNILFPYQPIPCDRVNKALTQCFKGQECKPGSTYCSASINESGHDTQPPEAFPYIQLSKRAGGFSADGTCGPNHGDTICNPDSNVYHGICCSSYGWCGNTPAHCGDGCVSGCGNAQAPAPQSASTSRLDGRCGREFADATCDPAGSYGRCCSSYGYCGNSDGHCLPANGCQSGCGEPATPPTQGSPGGTSAREDGRCGTQFLGAPCDPKGVFGSCCSQYGYCGSSADHCLASNNCQSGCTLNTGTSNPPAAGTTSGEPVIKTIFPNSPITGPVTQDGTCGAKNGNTICGNFPKGGCCSVYGYCGNTDGHCGAGCQSGPCSGAAQPNSPSPIPAPTDPNGGSFAIVGQSGVAAMHAGLLPNGRVVFLDKVENYGQLKLANGQFAYSAEYDPITNLPFPLSYKSNAFCSGGIFLADGRFCSFGGNAPLTFIDPTVGDGFTAIRYLSRSFSDDSLTGQSWSEPGNRLASARWYASAQILGDGTVFVASGSLNGLNPTVQANNNPTYEILDASGVTNGVRIPLDILVKNQPYYMYPFIHLLSDGSLFIFVSKSADLFNVKANAVIRSFPDLPGSFRTYPNTGGSVLLPLSSANNWNPDIVICGGGSYQDATSPTDASCGRIQPFSLNPTWEMDAMPEGRGMVEGTLLPNGHVIWLNGCNLGAQGFGLASNPTLEALIYDPTKPLGQRFTKGPYSAIARLYHSIALLLLDGTILISGSNPVEQPKLVPDAIDKYVTEYRVEIYTPPYLSGSNAQRRPTNINISTKTVKANGSTFTISFTSPSGAQNVKVSLYYGGFVTHSVHMGHRMAFLDTTGFVVGGVDQKLTVAMPPNNHIAPPGPYVIYVCVDDVPGIGQFVLVS